VEKYPSISAFTITYNQCDRLEVTLRDLLQQDYPLDLFEIIVVDDGSTDDTGNLLNDFSNRCPVRFKTETSIHSADYSSARLWNRAVSIASPLTELFVQLDDVRLRPDFLRAHAKWYSHSSPCLVTGAKFEGDEITFAKESCRRSVLCAQGESSVRLDHFTAIWGASLSFSRMALEMVFQLPFDTPYDERMTGWGYQEVELAYRMEKAGVILLYDQAAGVFHKNHEPVKELERGIDRAHAIAVGQEKNIRYLLEKHGLAELPRW
jgi:glycosyltransferase involved in cell wall biosynthesis